MTPFATLAPVWMQKLMADLDLTAEQAAGILGNLGFESGGFRALQEVNPRAGRGGIGAAQWTGPRRRAFERWCAQNGLKTSSDEANYGFLLVELRGVYHHTIDALKRTATLDDAVFSFGETYERPGGTTARDLPGFSARAHYAERALNGATQMPADIHPVLRLTNPVTTGDAVSELQRGLSAKGHITDVDGVFGQATEDALTAFQSDNGLKDDGICGPICWTALRRA